MTFQTLNVIVGLHSPSYKTTNTNINSILLEIQISIVFWPHLWLNAYFHVTASMWSQWHIKIHDSHNRISYCQQHEWMKQTICDLLQKFKETVCSKHYYPLWDLWHYKISANIKKSLQYKIVYAKKNNLCDMSIKLTQTEREMCEYFILIKKLDLFL